MKLESLLTHFFYFLNHQTEVLLILPKQCVVNLNFNEIKFLLALAEYKRETLSVIMHIHALFLIHNFHMNFVAKSNVPPSRLSWQCPFIIHKTDCVTSEILLLC